MTAAMKATILAAAIGYVVAKVVAPKLGVSA
jgi:hypothetical protein